jgi:hypothetical protein
MRLEDYLQQKLDALVDEISAAAPVDPCTSCRDGYAHLVLENGQFYYTCEICGVQWLAANLEIDAAGQLTFLELAD